MKSFLRVLLATLLGLILLTVVAAPFVLPVLPFIMMDVRRPSDEALIAQWRDKRPVFEQLAGMLKEDRGLQRLWSDAIDPTDSRIAPERVALYRKLMRDAGIISLGNYEREVEFVMHASGLTGSGASKSILFGELSSFAEEVDGDLEKATQGQSRGTFQRPIEGLWRLQLDKS